MVPALTQAVRGKSADGCAVWGSKAGFDEARGIAIHPGDASTKSAQRVHSPTAVGAQHPAVGSGMPIRPASESVPVAASARCSGLYYRAAGAGV